MKFLANPASGREEDLNPGSPGYKSRALTTRPRRLPYIVRLNILYYSLSRDIDTWNIDRDVSSSYC